jgi:DNA polymerase-3 subunit epsilon
MNGIGFAVVDVETTGLSPRHGDRIVEIGITQLNSNLAVEDTLETLLNPGRDVGPTSIHGITAEMICHAPTFADVAPAIVAFVDGRIVVAHNALFDLRFIESEMERTSYGDRILKHLCTLNLAKAYIGSAPSYKLACLCDYFDITLQEHHSALADSQATAALLAILANEYGALESLDATFVFHSKSKSQRRITTGTLTRKAFSALQNQAESPLAAMLRRLPTRQLQGEAALAYHDLLDRALLDRTITSDEAQALLETAQAAGLTRDQVMRIHLAYLTNLVRVALIDGVVTDSENVDLRKVGRLLAIAPGELDQTIAREKMDTTTCPLTQVAASYAGKSVCFTGELAAKVGGRHITRELAQSLSMERGLVLRNGVTKNLDYLVVADPNTQSTKAQKARSYGVTLVSESAYWQMIGLQVE